MGAPSDMGAGSRPRLGVPFPVNARYRLVDQVDLQCANVILGLPYSGTHGGPLIRHGV
jgi:hypothetical protein